MAGVVQRASSDPRLERWRPYIKHWIYVDDWTMQVPLSGANVLMDVVVEHLHSYNMKVKYAKCAFHVPALCNLDEENWPAEASAMTQRIPHRREGLTLLGTIAAGDLGAPLYDRDLPESAQKRRDHALQLAGAVIEMVNLAPQAGARQAAFALGRCIVAHCLDFDAGVLPSSVLLPHAGAIDEAVIKIAAATMDLRPADLSSSQRRQMCLPTRHAGLQLDLPSLLIPLACTARVIESGPAVRSAVASWAVPTDSQAPDPLRLDGVDGMLSDGMREMLSDRGVHDIGGGGKPVAEGQVQAADPFRPAAPERHLLSRYLRHTAAARYRTLFTESAAPDQTRLLSAGGPIAGASLVAPLNFEDVTDTDRQRSLSLRWRLGVAHAGPPQPCKNQRCGDGAACEEMVDASGDHPVECKFGPLRNRRHDSLVDDYADILEEVGAIARREVFVPEWSAEQEAWLDVWASGLLEVPDALLDITVRHPRAERYQPGASEAEAFAASKAEQEKDTRYPSRCGRSVWPVAHETWGRLGPQAESLLQTCAAAAARRAYRRGRLPGACLRRWRAKLDATLHRSVAAQLAAAWYGLPGRQRRRASPLDRACLEARCCL